MLLHGFFGRVGAGAVFGCLPSGGATRWSRPALLICDDFAMRAFTATQADDLYEVISERAGASLVITANRSAEDWYSLFPNPVVAESILDRVVNGAHHISMPGRSYRPNHRGITATSG